MMHYRYGAAMREYPKSDIVRFLELSRRAVLSVGEELMASGNLAHREDIFFLYKKEILIGKNLQAIVKAQHFKFNLQGAVMASDAFFPFPDCVEIADNAGIKSVIQPGGSIKDQLSIDYCNAHNIAMVFTGTRHFKH